MHKLDDDTLITADLLRTFARMAEDDGGRGEYFALIQKSDRALLAHNPGSPELDPVQMAYSQRLLAHLNREIAHDGAWVLLWTHPGFHQTAVHVPGAYAVMHLVWLDTQGDAKCEVEWTAGQSEDWTHIVELFLAGDIPMVQQAETAWQTANQLYQATLDVGINDSNRFTYNRAGGEKAPSLN